MLREALRRVETAAVTVAGDSMAPLLMRGDLIGLERVELSEVRVGQIVTFSQPQEASELQTHRVIATAAAETGQPFLLTRGDRTLLFDPPVSAEQVIGRVLWRKRNGRVLDLDGGPGGWLSAQLGREAERERRVITGVPVGSDHSSVGAVRVSDAVMKKRSRALWARGLHLGSEAWGRFLEFAVTVWASSTRVEL